MRSRSEASGEAGPQMTISVWVRKAGAKKTRPWMWSRWRWVRRMCRRVGSLASAKPRLRMPVPASRASSEPSERVTPTQEVLPPYRMVSGPGDGIEPRVPQSLTFISAARAVRGGRPEDRDRSAGPVRRQDREGGCLDDVPGAVGGADLEVGVGRATVAHRHDEGKLVVGDRLAVLIEWAEEGAPLLRANGPELLEAFAQKDPGGLVVEDEDPALIHQKCRRGQRRHEIASEDQLEGSLRHG